MNNIWISYFLIFNVVVFWVVGFYGESISKKLFKKLCSKTLPSMFSLLRYIEMKKCLFNLNEKELDQSDKIQVNRLRIINKIHIVSFLFIIFIAIFVMIK